MTPLNVHQFISEAQCNGAALIQLAIDLSADYYGADRVHIHDICPQENLNVI